MSILKPHFYVAGPPRSVPLTFEDETDIFNLRGSEIHGGISGG
jgi:hypothetical protein